METTDVDQRVIQVERAKLADKYEKCFRGIFRYIARANRNNGIGIPEMYFEVVERIEKVYKPKEVPNVAKKEV